MRIQRICAGFTRPLALASVAAVAVVASAAPEQLTSSTGDSSVERLGPLGSGLFAIESSGDLTPEQSGNADGSVEVYLARLSDGSLRQVTSSSADSSVSWITDGGLVLVASDGDLTPGAPGNADGSDESWVYRPRARGVPDALTQISASPENTAFRAYWEKGDRAFLTSQGDLTPGAPGNADGSREVFACDPDGRKLVQVTNSDEDSTLRAICGDAPIGVLESRGDLAPARPGNSDGSREIYLVDLRTFATKQVTSSAGDTRYRGQDAKGRLLAFESDGDLTPADARQPGNADGSVEVFVYDRKKRRLRQMTHSSGDSSFAGFVPHSSLVAVTSREDLAPAAAGSPGNADGSRELFTVSLRNGRVVQQTASSGDSSLAGLAGTRNGLAAVISDGDLEGGTSAVGAEQVFLVRIGARRAVPARLTGGASDSSFEGFDPSGRTVAIQSRADLVPASPDAPGNADLSREVFVARTTGRPRMRQLTASVRDSSFGAFVGDGRSLLVSSRGDLDPAGPGNADGSLEVFRVRYR